MKGVVKVMGKMNQKMNIPQIQSIMAEFEKQNEMMGMKEEMMSDAMDDAFADDEDEEEEENLLNAILPLYFNVQILRCLQESVASELSARMTAMQSASDNAKQLKNTLSLEMNRARQAEVTQGILEVVAGAMA